MGITVMPLSQFATVISNGRVHVLYYRSTPVAAWVPDRGFLVTDNKSTTRQTTSRIEDWLGTADSRIEDWLGTAETTAVPQEELDNLI